MNGRKKNVARLAEGRERDLGSLAEWNQKRDAKKKD